MCFNYFYIMVCIRRELKKVFFEWKVVKDSNLLNLFFFLEGSSLLDFFTTAALFKEFFSLISFTLLFSSSAALVVSVNNKLL